MSNVPIKPDYGKDDNDDDLNLKESNYKIDPFNDIKYSQMNYRNDMKNNQEKKKYKSG